MNKRDTVLSVLSSNADHTYVPAAFFLHFDPAYHRGQAAVDKHIEFFNATGMDFVKVQYEQMLPPPADPIRKPADWARVPRYPPEFSTDPVGVVEGLVKAKKQEALVIMTVYSPFMWAARMAEPGVLVKHMQEDPGAVSKGLQIMTENVIDLLKGCMRAGVDGFYVSTQGGEANRFPTQEVFKRYIKPTDLAVWDAIKDRTFNILHVCDYNGPYDDLSPYVDYPGHVVNCSLVVGGKTMTPKDAAAMFRRPFMGGLERKAELSTGTTADVKSAAEAVLAQAPDQFILGADCTVLAGTPWENLRTAVDTAHTYRS